MSDERRPAAYSLADELRDTGLVDVPPRPVLETRVSAAGIMAAAVEMFDPVAQRERRAAYAGVVPAGPSARSETEAPPKTRAERVVSVAKSLEKHYGDRLYQVPSMPWFERLSEAQSELVLDALRKLEDEENSFLEFEYAHPELDLSDEEEFVDDEDEVHDDGKFAWLGDGEGDEAA